MVLKIYIIIWTIMEMYLLQQLNSPLNQLLPSFRLRNSKIAISVIYSILHTRFYKEMLEVCNLYSKTLFFALSVDQKTWIQNHFL